MTQLPRENRFPWPGSDERRHAAAALAAERDRRIDWKVRNAADCGVTIDPPDVRLTDEESVTIVLQAHPRPRGEHMTRAEAGMTRWEVFVDVAINPKLDPDHSWKWEDGATMHFSSDMTREQCVAAYLRGIADEIESGELPGEADDE